MLKALLYLGVVLVLLCTPPINVHASEEACDVLFMSDVNDDSLKLLIADAKACAPNERIRVTVQSSGGLIDSAIFVHGYLTDSMGGKIDTHVAHSAESSAVLLFLMGERRSMSPNATLLFHENFMYNDERVSTSEAREMHEGLTNASLAFARIVSQRSNLTIVEVLTLMRDHKRLSAAEALDLGLATRVTEQSNTVP